MRPSADRVLERWRAADSWALTSGVTALVFIVFMLSLGIVRGTGSNTPDRGPVLIQDRAGGNPLGAGSAAPSGTDRAEAPPSASSEASADTPSSSLPGVDVHVNDRAGYLFSYPDGWELSRSGETDELSSPGGEIVMSFGMAPSGPLRQASTELLEGLATYSDIDVVSDKVERTEQGQRGMVIGATATDTTGATVRLMAITIRGPGENRAIMVQFSAGSDPLKALPAIREIVGSFRTSSVAS